MPCSCDRKGMWDRRFFEFVLPFKATISKKNDTSNVLQDINHIKSFNNDYPEMPNNDDRVVPNLNSDYKSQSDSSHSSMSSGGVDTADFPSNNFGNDADSSDDIFAAQDEQKVFDDVPLLSGSKVSPSKPEWDLHPITTNNFEWRLATQQSPKEPFDLIEELIVALFATISGAHSVGTAIISHVLQSNNLKNPFTYFLAEPKLAREMMPPPGFSTPPQIPSNTTSERLLVTTTVFTATILKNTPFAYHASTSTNPNPTISPAFMEANYEILESLLRERRRQIRIEDLRTEIEYFSEDYDEERDMEPRLSPARKPNLNPRLWEGNRRGRNAEGIRPSEIEAREGENRGRIFPHLWQLTWEEMKTVLGITYEHESQRCSRLRMRSLARHSLHEPFIHLQSLMEKTYTWVEAREVATNGASNDQRDNFESLSKSPKEILVTEKAARSFDPPLKMFESKKSQATSKYCHFHKDYGHDTNDYRHLRTQIQEAVMGLALPPRERNKERKDEKLNPAIKATRVDLKTPLLGFSGECSWPIGEVLLEITIGDAPLSRTETLNFVIIRSDSLHNMLLGRTAMQRMGIIVSTIHGAIKFHTEKGIRIVFSTDEADEGAKRARKIHATNKEWILSCINAEEKIIVNDKYPYQTVTIGRQLPNHFKKELQKPLKIKRRRLRMDTR
ncbi:hypothetical protein Tco_1575252 [Tanacetum coccineum]